MLKSSPHKLAAMRKRYAENREKIRAQIYAYRAANPGKVVETRRRHFEKNREALYAKHRAWKLANPEVYENLARQYRETHRDEAKLRSQQWRAENPERFLASVRKWQEVNWGKVLAYSKKQKADRLNRVPLWADGDAIAIVYQAAEIAKATWPEFEIHVDHAIPLCGRTVSGLHVHTNLHLLTAQANLRKGNSFEHR